MTKSIKLILIITLLIIKYQQGFCQNWLPLNRGIGCDSYPFSIINNIYADIEGDLIYMSGTFFYMEDGEYETCEYETSGLTVWNGNRFTNLKGGKYFQQGREIFKYVNNIYESAPIVYEDISDSHLSKWNGNGWDSLIGSPNSRVSTSRVIDGEVWLAGWFDQCANQYSPMIAKFDGENFYPLNNEFPLQDANFISAMDFLNDTLFVAGDFRNWGIDSADSLSTFAKFYNNRLYGIKPYLSSISGINYDCLVNYKNDLYLGGYMQFIGDDTVRYFLRYDGKNFRKVGPDNMQMNQQPVCMKVYNDELYILGMFDKLGEQEAHQLVKWDGEKYTILNTDTIKTKYGVPAINAALSVTSFDILNDTLYLAGSFYTIGNDTMRSIAKFNHALTDYVPPVIPTENSLTLYPNPSSNEVTIEYSLNGFQNVSFSIYDMQGRLIKKIEKGNKLAGKYVLEKVDVSKLANGIYFVQMQTDKESIVKKLLKE